MYVSWFTYIHGFKKKRARIRGENPSVLALVFLLFDKLELVFYFFLFFLVSLSIMYRSIPVSKSWKTNGLIINFANLGCFE